MSETPETAYEVPDELLLLGLVEGHNDGRENLDDFEIDYDHGQFLDDALAAVLPAHEAMVRRAYHAELFGTPEEIRQREIEAKANAKPDDPIELCERIRPGLHEQRVRVKVAEELRADADAHRRLIARKPSRHDEVRLARARTLDDAAARITRGEQP